MQFNNLVIEKNLELATKYLEKQKNNKAIKYLNKVLDKNPSNDEAWLLLGIAKRRIGNLEDAIESLKTATNLNNSMLEAWGLLTITLIDKGNLKEAKATIDMASDLNPSNSKIKFLRENLVHVYIKFGPFF